MIEREMQKHIKQAAKGFPVITITGPRQSGKTTLAKMAFEDYRYIDLELMQNRLILRDDPRALLNDPKGRYIIDEFQYVPEVLSWVKVMADASGIRQQFILTGSNHFVMMEGVSQSLAGRTAIFELLPFSLREGYPQETELDRLMYRGFYPRLVREELDPGLFYGAYISTYLQKDLRALTRVHDLELFGRFLILCASRTGSLLNKQSLANDAGIDAKTVDSWLSILQTSYIIHLMQPYFGNVGKRLTKSPKLYFYDPGLVCNLLGIRGERDLATHPLRGHIFETMVVGEMMKYYLNQGLQPRLSFYRDLAGLEIDVLIPHANTLLPIEIKSAQTVNPALYRNLLRFFDKNELKDGWLVYGGEISWKSGNILNLGLWDLEKSLRSL